MEYSFRDWCACPECGVRDEVSTLAHEDEIVFECYECGLASRFEIGEAASLKNLDPDAIADSTDEGTGD